MIGFQRWFRRALPLILGMALSVSLSPAQAQLEFDQLMRQGYEAAAQRNYPEALIKFSQALALQPNNSYAQVAVNNISFYLNRDLQQAPSRIPDFDLPDLGKPNYTESGGQRSGRRVCLQDTLDPSLLVLTPQTTIGATVLTRPSLLVYVPAATPAQQLKFVFADVTTYIPLDQSPGLVQLQVPLDLEPGQSYLWTLKLICDRNRPEKDPRVDGEIKRISLPDFEAVITQAPLIDRLALLQSQGIWYDTVATLAELRRMDPLNPRLQRQWTTLLQSQDLEDIAPATLLECCEYPSQDLTQDPLPEANQAPNS